MTLRILPRSQALPYKPSVDGEDTLMYTVVCWMHDIYTLQCGIEVRGRSYPAVCSHCTHLRKGGLWKKSNEPMKQQFGGDIYINLAITITRSLPRDCPEIALQKRWKNVSRTACHQAHLREEERAAAVRKCEMEAACQDWCACIRQTSYWQRISHNCRWIVKSIQKLVACI